MRILIVLRDGKSVNFQQLLSFVAFSHNILRLHLAQLVEQVIVVRRKMVSKALGDHSSPTAYQWGFDGRTVLALVSPYKGLVVLPFEKLRRIYRQEKGGYCKEIMGRWMPQDCPQNIK